LILCSILIHPSCLNTGSESAMGSWSNINLAVLFYNLRMWLSPSLNNFPKQHSNNQLKAKCNLNKKVALIQGLNIS
jgi:hypothetical protein